MSSKDPIHLERRDAVAGLRLQSPSAGRNAGPIADIVVEVLPENARVLEIASGTGEHAVSICSKRPDLTWQNSDPDERSRQSQDGWREDLPNQLANSLAIDTTQQNWWSELQDYDAIYCANMIHIAPWEAALGLAKGAELLIGKGGTVILYGPFLEGEQTAESNLRFDMNLKTRNPSWGVRSLDSVKHIFADVGFTLSARIEMPAENRILIFSRT
ncbi:MAG: DUF938 domain-containing protein [Hellea sp.]|nr:DUF938 domain-containing protein [Hellea sp.]